MYARLTGPNRGKRPYARRVIFCQPFWFLAFQPAEKAWFVLPHVPGARQDRAVFDPDDLLVNEGPVLLPYRFEQSLSPASVPAIPGCTVSDGYLQCDLHKCVVERVSLFRTIHVGVFVAPVFVAGMFTAVSFGPFVRVIGTVVIDQIGWIGGK